MKSHMTNTLAGSMSHNGPICDICGVGYIGKHRCDPDVLRAQIARLQRALGCPSCGQQVDGAHYCPVPQAAPGLTNFGCPCRPENGGSGVCGCVLGGLKVTCR